MGTTIAVGEKRASASPRAASLDRNDRWLILIVGDAIASAIAAFAALVLWSRASTVGSWTWLLHKSFWAVIFCAVWIAAAALIGSYMPSYAHRTVRSWPVLLATAGLVFIAYSIVYFFSPRAMLPRVVVLAFVASAILVVGGWRRLWDWASGHPSLSRGVVVVGTGRLGAKLAEILTLRPNSGYRVIGFVEPGRPLSTATANGIPILGGARELSKIVDELGVREVVLALRGRPDRALVDAVLACHERGVVVTDACDLYEATTGRFPIWHLADGDIALPWTRSGRALYLATKRVMDVVVASLGLIVFVLVLPFVAIAVKLDSSGPLFYRQSRTGRGGRLFTIWKLRTMTEGAEEDGPTWAAVKDPRMTRVGRLLRRTHLDELAQLFNVLRGEMSLVGPRPERPEIDRRLEEEIPLYRLRLTVKPGIAGWGAVNGPYVDDPEKALERLEYDLYYINHQSLWLDLQILTAAVHQAVMLRGR